jgi:putative glycosyltransferase (TIGR04372 family)
MNVLKRLAKAPLFAFSFFVLLVMKLIQPIIKFQLCVVGFHRYGHLALEPEIFLAEQEVMKTTNTSRRRVISIWSLGPVAKQSNSFLASKWKEALLVLPSWFVGSLQRVGLFIPFLKLEEPKLSITGSLNGLDKTAPHISLNVEELEKGKKLLTEIGINPDKPYVCLIVRDGGHYKSKGDIESAGYSMLNFDIDTFVLASEFLVSEGFQVVRMGSGSEKPFSNLPTGVFDYAHAALRSEFLDVFLAATCAFAVSTQTGPDAVCMLFRRPVLYVDVTRYSQFFFGMQKATWTPARLFSGGRLMSLSEISQSEVAWFKDPNEFLENEITQQKSSPDELCQIVQSYVQCLNEKSLLTNRYSLVVGEGMGQRGIQQFGAATALSVPNVDEILGEWANN